MIRLLLGLTLLVLTITQAQAQVSCTLNLKIGIIRLFDSTVMARFDQLASVDLAMVEIIEQQSNICFKLVHMPSTKRLLDELKKGNIDVVYSASYNEQRAKYGWFSIPYRDEAIRIFTKKSVNEKYPDATLHQLLQFGLIGSANSDNEYGPTFTQVKRLIQHNVPLRYQRISMLQLDRVDFTVEDELSGQFYINYHGIKNIVMHPFVVNRDSVHFLYSRKSVDKKTVDQIDKIIEKNREQLIKIKSFYIKGLNYNDQ